jgi:hypothetical protein
VGLLLALSALTGCGAPGALSESSHCSDWNKADVNAQGTYLHAEYPKVPHLNAYTGYASGGITYYCSDNPGANLGDITRKVARS